MTRILALILLSSAGLVQAAAAAAPATTNAPAPKRFPGVSDAGNAVLAKAQATPDPQRVAMLKQQRAARDQLNVAMMASTIDVDAVAAAFRQDEAAQGVARAYDHERIISVLKQLPEEDRGTFLRTLLMSRAPRPAAPAAGAPKP